jgi:multiple sugar transport system permease protein
VDWMPLPLLAVLALVIAYPAVRAVTLGFSSFSLTNPDAAHWVGALNYRRLAQDPVFWQALRNTAVYTGVSVAAGFGLGLLLALIVDPLSARLPLVQTVLLSPWAVPVIVTAFLFRYMFEQEGGLVNAILLAVHAVPAPLPWLASGRLAMAAVIAANVWSQTPFFLLVFLSALKGVPESLVEAARVDGAGEWAIARHVKVPQLSGSMVPAVLIAVITNFNNFGLVWSMTGGGPAYDTTTLVVYVYRLAFSQFDVGYAAAVGTIWLVVLLAFAVVFVRVARARAPEAWA